MSRLLSLSAAFGILLLFAGQAGGPLAGSGAPYPAWLLLPPDARILGAVAYLTPKQSEGVLAFAAGADGRAVIAAWDARLRAAGFTVLYGLEPGYCSFGIDAALRAEQPATGRGLTLALSSDDIELYYSQAP